MAVGMLERTGRSIRSVARDLGIPYATLARMQRNFRLRGNHSSKAKGNRKPKKITPAMLRTLGDLLDRTPDLTIAELRNQAVTMWKADGVVDSDFSVSESTVHTAVVHRLVYSYKNITEIDRRVADSDIQEQRVDYANWLQTVIGLSASHVRIINVDESNFSQRTRRSEGWAPVGEPAQSVGTISKQPRVVLCMGIVYLVRECPAPAWEFDMDAAVAGDFETDDAIADDAAPAPQTALSPTEEAYEAGFAPMARAMATIPSSPPLSTTTATTTTATTTTSTTTTSTTTTSSSPSPATSPPVPADPASSPTVSPPSSGSSQRSPPSSSSPSPSGPVVFAFTTEKSFTKEAFQRMLRHLLDVCVREALRTNLNCAQKRIQEIEGDVLAAHVQDWPSVPVENIVTLDNVNIHGRISGAVTIIDELEIAAIKDMDEAGELSGFWTTRFPLQSAGAPTPDSDDGGRDGGDNQSRYECIAGLAAAACRIANASGTQVKFLPPYTPSLAPIEYCFWVVKSGIRALQTHRYHQHQVELQAAKTGTLTRTRLLQLKTTMEDVLEAKEEALAACVRNTMRFILTKVCNRIIGGQTLGQNDIQLPRAQVDQALSTTRF